MSFNSEKVLFEGTVMNARKTMTTDPPSEIIDLNYTVEPCNVYDAWYDSITDGVVSELAYTNTKGWVQICLPVFNGLKPGDKIKVVKV